VGFIFNRRKSLGRGIRVNMSKSGASVSKRKGRVTVNSRGRLTIRLGRGIGFRL
jgi:hypothetical protein